tara:strand:- start:763 stop:2625 length:1863 start_codon:yes stop_codon:yes gene_type:complete
MLTHTLHKRDNKLSLLIKMGDCLGRSLRENVELFSITENEATYLTESNNIIRGNYSISKDVILEDIKVEPADIFENSKKYDAFVGNKVGDFVHSLYENSYPQAEVTFSNLLSLWEDRLKFDKVKLKITEAKQKFGTSTNIINTPEFTRLLEATKNIANHLKENNDNIENIEEIKNSVKLSNTVSKAFDFPRLSYDNLVENNSYTLKNGNSNSIYEIICQQELIRKELLTSKENFEVVWASNDKINEMCGHVFNPEVEDLTKIISEAIAEVPYLALASKKQILKVINNSMSLNESVIIKDKDLKNFASRIFEIKKPAKELFIKTLNEQYGINVNTLKDTPSFKSLLNAQVVVFESLARVCSKDSINTKVLSEMASLLKRTNGVEAIDINDYLSALFYNIGFSDVLQENSFMNYVDLSRVATDLEKIGQVLKTMGGAQQGMPGEEQGMPGEEQAMRGGEEQYPSDETMDQEAPMDAERAAAEANGEFDQEVKDEQMDQGMEQDQMGEQMPEEEEEIPSEDIGQDQLMANLEKLNSLVSDLTTEIESAKGEAGMDSEEGLEGEEEEVGLPPEEEEGNAGVAAGGNAVDKEEADQNDDGVVDSEELEDIAAKKKKKKPFPPKEM